MSEYSAGKYFIGKTTKDIRQAEDALTQRFRTVENGVISTDSEQQEWIKIIEELSQGKNTVIFDEAGLPSIYYRMPVRTRDQLVSDGSNDYFESWIVDDALISELYVAKYLAHNVSVNNKTYAVSLRGLDPTTNINFDNALAACNNKGTGHSLNTNANWMQLVFDSYQNGGFQAHGNTSYGKWHSDATERGEGSYRYNDQVGRTKTGSGPNTWSHDGSPFGVFDMVGNVWEWVGGLKTANGGEILVLPNNNAMNKANSQASGATTYKGISAADGSYQDSGTEGNLFYGKNSESGSTPVITDSTHVIASTALISTDFRSLAASEITVPGIAQRLGLAPNTNNDQLGRFYQNATQEDLAYRGGGFDSTSGTGCFALCLNNTRSASRYSIGFRSAFYKS